MVKKIPTYCQKLPPKPLKNQVYKTLWNTKQQYKHRIVPGTGRIYVRYIIFKSFRVFSRLELSPFPQATD